MTLPSASIHCIGICGTGMAGLACLLKQLGHDVSGSDEHVYPPMSDVLDVAGITIGPFARANVERPLDRVVLGGAVSRQNCEAIAAIEAGLPLMSQAEALSHYVLDGREVHVVAGTHGKTTTSAMLAWIHETAGRGPGFMIGGVPRNFAGSARLPDGGAFIVEGDEYKSSFIDRQPKFHKYRPRVGIVTNAEFDHADVFPDFVAVTAAFAEFARLVDEDGLLVTSAGSHVVDRLRQCARCRVVTVGWDDAADWRLADSRGGRGSVELVSRDGCDRMGPFRLAVPGAHNVLNAAVAAVAARFASIGNSAIVHALETFAGVCRRLETVAETGGVRVIDDFAHHPTEVAASIRAIRDAAPDRHLWAIFEPRSLTSRMPLFQDDYASALSGADRVTVLAVPPWKDGARTLDADALVDMVGRNGQVASRHHSVDAIAAEVLAHTQPGTDLLVMSSGSFGGLVQLLRHQLRGGGSGPRPQGRATGEAENDTTMRELPAGGTGASM